MQEGTAFADLSAVLDQDPRDPKAISQALDQIRASCYGSNEPATAQQLSLVFSCLGPNDADQVTGAACDAAEAMVASSSSIEVLCDPEVFPIFRGGMAHADTRVRAMAIRQLGRIVLDTSTVPTSQRQEAISMLCTTLGDANAEVGLTTSRLLASMASSPAGVEALLAPAPLDLLRGVAVSSDTNRLRVLGLFVEVACASEEGFERCKAGRQLFAVVAEWSTDDVLVKLNAVELLVRLSETARGFGFLLDQGIIDSICTAMQDTGVDGALLAPSLLRAAAQWARHNTHVEHLVDAGLLVGVLGHLGNSDTQVMALSTLGALLHTDAGLTAVVARTPIAQILLDGLGSASNEVKQAALSAITQALELQGRCDATAAAASAQRIASSVQDLTMASLVHHVGDQVHQPDAPVVEAAWAALAACAQHQWGVQAIAAMGGYCEMLLDRSAMISKTAKEWKYDCVCSVVAGLTESPGLVQSDLATRLRAYKAEGPFAG